MRKLLFYVWAVLLPAFLMTGCSSEDIEGDMTELNASATSVQQNSYVASDLVGTWNMYSMTSLETTVDFDQNGQRTNDLLEETDCFDFMYFIFKDTGVVNTRQARLYFSSQTGAFSCQTTGDYAATYTVSGDILTVTFTVNGTEYTETRTISMYSENGNEFLKVTLTKEETNAAVYVADDPGNTVASNIQKIEMVYLKTQ